MPRPPRTAPPPRRRPVAGTRGRRPSADPTAAPPVEPVDSTTAEPVPSTVAADEEVVTEPVEAKAGGVTARPGPSPVRSPRAKAKPRPVPKPKPAPEADELTDPQGDRAGRGRFAVIRPWLVPGLVLLAVVLFAGACVLGGFVWQHQRTAAASKAALPAARSHAKEILSYDYRRVDADIARAKKDATGSFSKEYADTSKTVKPLALQYHVIVQATVKASSVVSASPDKVVVLLFVDQKTTSNRIAGPKTDQSRVRITLVKTGGKWLVSKIDAL